MTAGAALLLLSDGRFPSGGHAHSGGLEAAVENGTVADLESLESFLRGRLATVGLVGAAVAATACHFALTQAAPPWVRLDAEADARTPSPAQRSTSRRQGRHLLRAARRAWPALETYDPSGVHSDGPHFALALGAAAAAADLGPGDSALVAAHGSVAGPASAAVRLLRLDPMAVAAILARLSPAIDEVAERGDHAAAGPIEELPAAGAPLLDLGAEAHAARPVRLFAS